MKKILLSGVALSTLMSTALLAGGSIAPVEVEPVSVPDEPMVEAVASDRLYNVALSAGTLGVGVHVATPIDENFQLRINANGGSYSDSTTEDGIDYDADLTLANVGLLVDYFPWQDLGFHLSAGAYYNGNKVEATATPTAGGEIEVGKYGTFKTDDLVHLNAKVDWDKFAPYVGLGWGNDSRTEGWGFSIDLGVLIGTPKETISYEISDTITSTEYTEQTIKEAINDYETELDDTLSDYNVYPVVTVGFTYTF